MNHKSNFSTAVSLTSWWSWMARRSHFSWRVVAVAVVVAFCAYACLSVYFSASCYFYFYCRKLRLFRRHMHHPLAHTRVSTYIFMAASVIFSLWKLSGYCVSNFRIFNSLKLTLGTHYAETECGRETTRRRVRERFDGSFYKSNVNFSSVYAKQLATNWTVLNRVPIIHESMNKYMTLRKRFIHNAQKKAKNFSEHSFGECVCAYSCHSYAYFQIKISVNLMQKFIA